MEDALDNNQIFAHEIKVADWIGKIMQTHMANTMTLSNPD
jgi:hypothetical protein